MKNLILRLAKDECGATAIEYGLIAGVISIGILASVTAIGSTLKGTFVYIDNQLP